jgi:hypothetical protein
MKLLIKEIRKINCRPLGTGTEAVCVIVTLLFLYLGFRIRITFDGDPDAAFFFHAYLDPDSAPHQRDAYRICGNLPTDPPGLHFEPPRLFFKCTP